MKKLVFFVIIAGLLTGCTLNDNLDANVPSQDPDFNLYVPIEIGLGQVTVNTRGTGTVGGTAGTANNVWCNQMVNILMFKKGTLDLALIDPVDDPNPIYDHAVFRTQEVEGSFSNRAIDMTGSIKYYPSQGEFDFWGYRLDGADASFTPPVYDVDATGCSYPGDELKLDFKIDGSQDIMVAKAVPSADDWTNRPRAAARAFSAYAARNGVQPELIFEHLLTRLDFVVVAGDSAATGTYGIFVDTITVASKATGKLIAAYTANVTKADDKRIEWDETAGKEMLYLKRRPVAGDLTFDPITPVENQNLVDLDPIQPTGKGGPFTNDFVPDSVKVGEALLVAPDTEYEIVIKLHQDVLTQDNVNTPEVKRKNFSHTNTLKLEKGGAFLKGHTYKVVVKLHGLTEINVMATLTGWQEGETISISPEANF